MKKFLGLIIASSALSFSGAHADENLLGYTAGAETLPRGTYETYMHITHKDGKRRGDYQRQDIRAEIEYGLTDRLTIAAYLNGHNFNYKCPTGCAGSVSEPEIMGASKFGKISGFSLEAKKMILSPYKDGLGVSLYGEVTYDSLDDITGEKGDAFEVETKLILQKPYMDGQLQWVNNLELEAESFSPKIGGGTEYAIAPRWRTGVAYRFAPNWYIGGEGWIDAELLNPADGNWEFDHWDTFFGPSIHYGGEKFWITATYAHQIAGSNEAEDNKTGRHLADHEKNELKFKIGYNF